MTSSGSFAVRTPNAGAAGVSGDISLSTGTSRWVLEVVTATGRLQFLISNLCTVWLDQLWCLRLYHDGNRGGLWRAWW